MPACTPSPGPCCEKSPSCIPSTCPRSWKTAVFSDAQGRLLSKMSYGMKVMSPVAISHQNQKFLAKYYDLNQAEIPVVYNPVELSKFDDPKPRTNSEFTFISAGRFSAQKNQKLMLRAFAAFLQRGHDANLVLLGKGEEEENLRALAHHQ